MRNFIRTGSFVLASLTLLQVAAFADSIEGRVAQTAPGLLSVTVYDAQGRPYQNTLHLNVDDRTQLRGVQSLEGLRQNDAIGAEVSQQEGGAWHADSVTLFQEVNAQPATKQPSASLKDALGSSVVRGALLGAATGAIASSASGGKAGKGALVGAGVGAAAGLLGDMFSSHSKSSSDDSNR